MKLYFRFLISLFFVFQVFSVPSVRAAPFGMNDVSILLPLPEASGIGNMLSPVSDAGNGALLPAAIYETLGDLVNGSDSQMIYDEQLKVIGIRIDPCFQEGIGVIPCRRQIRLVWQPVFAAIGVVETEDAAVHTFYDFSETEWPNVVASFEQIAGNDLSAPLQINPTISQEGYSSLAWARLKNIVLKFCGANHLTRATVMRMNLNRMWTFLGFNQTDSGLVQMNIPHLVSPVETYVQDESVLDNLHEFDGKLAPAPDNDPSLIEFILSSIQFKNEQPEANAKQVMNQVIQFENPNLHNSGTVDCASCHLAQTVHFWGENNFPNWNWQNDFGSSHFQSNRNLKNESVNPAEANRLRAFGYFGAEPIFSQRVINETAKVSEALNSNHSRHQ